MDHGFQDRTELLWDISREAGSLLRHFFGSDLKIRNKGDVDLVTEADERVEQLLVTKIEKCFPDDAILTEEGRNRDGNCSYRWIIDPLDGTTNFAHGLPHFATSIALEKDGELMAGVVHDPIKREFFHAERSKGAFLNGRPIHTGKKETLETCLCVSGFPYDRRKKLAVLLRRVSNALAQSHGFRRLGAASLDLAYVACGRLDVYWEDTLHPWDVAAGVVLVREAGGSVAAYDGQAFDLFSGEIVAANSTLINDVVKRVIER